MSFDEIFDLTAGVYFNFYNIYGMLLGLHLLASVAFGVKLRFRPVYVAFGVKLRFRPVCVVVQPTQTKPYTRNIFPSWNGGMAGSAGYTGGRVNIHAVPFPGDTAESIFRVRHGVVDRS